MRHDESDMTLIAEAEGKRFYSLNISSVGPLSIGSDEPFVCLLWDHGGLGGQEPEHVAFARALIQSGCRYSVSAGKSCENWEAAFDLAWVEEYVDVTAEQQERDHVMTSSHEGEEPDAVAFFFVMNTCFDDHDFQRYVVIHLGEGPDLINLNRRVAAWALHPSEQIV